MFTKVADSYSFGSHEFKSSGRSVPVDRSFEDAMDLAIIDLKQYSESGSWYKYAAVLKSTT